MDKENVVHLHNGVLFCCLKKSDIMNFCWQMDGTRVNQDQEQQTCYVLTYKLTLAIKQMLIILQSTEGK